MAVFGVNRTRLLMYTMKLLYFPFRIFLRVILGKKVRDKLLRKYDIVGPSEFFAKLCSLVGLFTFKGDYSFEDIGDLNILFHPKDLWRYIKFKERTYEPYVLEVFKPKEGWTVVDIGAHIGYYTLIASKRVGDRGKVIAIEPHPLNFQLLKSNIHLNKVNNVIALKLAVSDVDGETNLYLGNTTGDHSITERVSGKSIKVKTVSLDNLLNKFKIQPNLIKIDVEGAELKVIKGAEKTLQEDNVYLILEVHYRLSDEIRRHLNAKGFNTKSLTIKGRREFLYAYKEITKL